MQKSIKIAIVFLRYQYFPHILLTLAFCLLSGKLVSFCNLDASRTAKVLEMYVVFSGIFLMTPLFLPEQERAIWRLEQSKKTSMLHIYFERFLIALFLMCGIVFCFLVMLKESNSTVYFGKMFLGSVSEMLFLGSLGFAISAIFNQVVLGYMVSVTYYAVNIGKSDMFGKFALFQMKSGIYDFWYFMIIGAVVLIVGSTLLREVYSKRV